MVRPLRILLLALVLLPASAPVALATQATPPAAACPVTAPNGVAPAGVPAYASSTFGTSALSTDLQPGAFVASDALFDGSVAEKWPWTRGVRGILAITGRRLDGPASPLRSWIVDGYGDAGFQATDLIFPTPGCWEVTGRVDDASLTFVVHVIAPTASRIPSPTPAGQPADCPVTQPNGATPPGELPAPLQYGSAPLWTELWPGGRMVGPVGRAGESVPWFWWSGVAGRVSVAVWRLDGYAPDQLINAPAAYTAAGFQLTAIEFTTAGCYELTGRVGGASLTIVTRVG